MKKSIFFLTLTCALLTGCGESQHTQQKVASSTSVQAKPTSVLNLYNWSDYVDPATVKAFEQKNHIKIHNDYYDSNEVLEAKVLTGKSGYDLVVPGAANIGRQIQAGAYLPLDKSKIPDYKNLNPVLMKLMQTVDPGNKYAVPYFTGINTVGINVQKVKQALGTDRLPENIWDLVFDPKYADKLKSCGISWLDSPSEVFPVALAYLGLPPDSSKPEDLKAAAALMEKVRPDIKRFSSSGYINDLVNGDLCVALGYGGDINIAATRAEEAKKSYTIKALAPTKIIPVWIDSFAIPKDAVNLDNAYKYISYTLEPEIAAKNGNFVTYAPASLPAKALMEKKYVNNPSIFLSDEALKHGFLIKPFTPDGIRLSVRLWQKFKAGE